MTDPNHFSPWVWLAIPMAVVIWMASEAWAWWRRR